MAELGRFGWLLFFAVGWAIVAPILASYESSLNQPGNLEIGAVDFNTPDGSNPLTLVWDYLQWFTQVFNFQTNPATAFLTTFIFAPLTAVGLYAVIK